MNTWRFEDPLALLALLALIPLLVRVLRGTGSGRVRYSAVSLLRQVGRRPGWFARHGLTALRFAALALLVVAWARPQGGTKQEEVISEGVDIQLVVDTSGSMKALDFQVGGESVTRLDVSKNVVRDFIERRVNDRIGLVVFGLDAITQCPLTIDYGILLTLLDDLRIGMVGDGTAIGTALGTAVQRLKDAKSKSRIVVLLTDGRNNAGAIEPEQAARIARTYGVKVYTIGVGTRGKAPFLVDGLLGRRIVYQDADLDEETLARIAEVTGGRFFRATDTQSLLEIYRTIDQMEKTEIKTREFTRYEELYPTPLALGLLLLLAEFGLANTRFRRIP
ncbi:VWA domain-containing protein [Myxococcota bacterium]|nr:VWA domain-containing protein [Myxococcota bacterium]